MSSSPRASVFGRDEPMHGLDLSEDRAARRARKREVAVRVEFAGEGGVLSTREGPVRYATGDALLTGAEGERWPVARDTFDLNYEPVAPGRYGKPGQYRKRPRVVWAKLMTDAFDLTLGRDRGSLRGRPGDWLVQYAPLDFGVVSGRVFTQTYELLD
jgi:PGDYG protein